MSSPNTAQSSTIRLAAAPVPNMGVTTSANAYQPVGRVLKLKILKHKKSMGRRPWPYNEIIHLKVGPDKVDFGIHRNLLCSASSWFKDVLTEGSAEVKEGVICLPDDSLEILEFFNLWIYTNSLNDPDTGKPPSAWTLLLDIYLWAGYRGVPRLQNVTIDVIQAQLAPGEGIPLLIVDRIYNATPRPIKLRSLAAVSFLRMPGGFFNTFVAYGDQTGDGYKVTLATEMLPPREFLYDVILLQKEKLDALGATSDPLLDFERCYFHVHPDVETCLTVDQTGKRKRPEMSTVKEKKGSEREMMGTIKDEGKADGKRLRLLGDKTVSIVVGAEKRLFAIHKGLLCSVSDYFRAALDGNFKEAEEQKIELLEDDPKVVARFQLWLYSGKVIDEGEDTTALDYPMLVNIYVFAETRRILSLQNHLVDTIIRKSVREHFNLRPSDGDMYSNTTTSSPLRKLAVHMAAHNGGLVNPSWDLDGYPKEFLVSLVLALHRKAELGKNPSPKWILWEDRCDFHVHAQGEPPCPINQALNAEDSSEEEEMW